MRKRIDGHVHIRPARLCGVQDPRVGATLLPYGRLCLSDGRTVQFLPPYFADSCFDTRTLLATMDAYNIERAVLMQSFAFGLNLEIAEAVRQHPDRLSGSMVLDLGRDIASQIHQNVAIGLQIIKFEMSPVLGYTHPHAFPAMRFDAAPLCAAFDLAQSYGLTVAVDTNMAGGKGYQVEALEKAIQSHPCLKFVICHLAFARPEYFQDDQKRSRWQAMLGLCRYDNVWCDISALPDLFFAGGYPFHQAVDLVQTAVKQYSAGKFIWGTDIPGTLRNATYQQMIDMFEGGLQLSEADKDKIFYQNAQTVYFGGK